MQIDSKFKPSFPKAILLMAVVCMVLMVKFKHPQPNFFKKATIKRAKLAQLRPFGKTEADIQSNVNVQKKTQSNLSVREELKAASKRGPRLDEIHAPIKTEPLEILKNASLKAEVLKTETPQNRAPKVSVPKSRDRKSPSNCLASLGKIKVNKTRISKKQKLSTQPVVKIEKPIEVQVPEPTWVENAFDESLESSTEYLAINASTPLDQIAEMGFSEISLSDSFNANPSLAAINFGLEDQSQATKFLSNEQRLTVKEGVFDKIEFTDLMTSLQKLSEESEKLPELTPAPLTRVAKNVLSTISKEPELVTPSGQLSSQTNQMKPQLVANEIISETKPEELGQPLNEGSTKIEPISEPRDITDELEEDEPTIVKMFNRKGLDVSPKLAAIGGSLLSSQSEAANTKFHPPVNTPKNNQVNNQNTESDNSEDPKSDGGMLQGTIEADSRFLQWLEENKGHVELSLSPIDSKDHQDTMSLLEYQFPLNGPDFEINLGKISGSYRLVAAVFLNSPIPVAQVVYKKLISAGSYKQRVYLPIKKEDVDSQNRNSDNRITPGPLSLTATVFEGAGGNYRQAKTIKNAEVSVVGFPELGVFKTDAEGNIRIANVPPQSEFMLSINAQGFYSSRQVVPIFSTSVYAPLYLVQKEKVESITKYFTKREQAEGKAIVMGRVFDTASRTPLADQEVSLSFRKGSALYFEALPDPRFKATRSSGLFGFFNVEPSFRSIYRSGGRYPMLLNVDANMGVYVEMGRGGARNLRSKLLDPFAGKPVFGQVRLVGGDVNELYSDNKGNVQIKGLDLPPGIVTLETEAEGFPKTWHTLPWSTREPEKKHTLYLLQNDMVVESAISIARTKKQNGTGSVFGGAHSSFFKKGRRKISVSLLSIKGVELGRDQGPFPISQPQKNPNEKLELTQANPGFAFYNLLPGEYVLKWKNEKGITFRSHVLRVGVDRVSVVVN